MGARKRGLRILGAAAALAVLAGGAWKAGLGRGSLPGAGAGAAVSAAGSGGGPPGTGRINVGKIRGRVVYDEDKDCYFIEFRGARFPFKTSPLLLEGVPLEVPGETDLEKNSALLIGILGPDVLRTTVLVDADEGEDVRPAVTDVARYVRIVNAGKFAGVSREGGPQGAEELADAGAESLRTNRGSRERPVIRVRGPKGGARRTRVALLREGEVLVEGRTYEELYQAADRLCLTLLKMLCGSPDCPNAAACASGGACGCG